MTPLMKLIAPVALFSLLAAAAQPPSNSGMSLREAVNYALEHSPDLAISQGGGRAPARTGHHRPRHS